MPSVNHKFNVGTRLLCFEPDILKAKLLYYAEVTQHCGYLQTGRVKVPQYVVHFLGWKKKWDRQVSEELLLDNSDFNRTLKRKIDEIAVHVKEKETRKERIDMILSNASVAYENIDWNNVPGVWHGPNTKMKNNSTQKEILYPKVETTDSKSFSDYSEVIEELDCDELSQINFESVDAHDKFAPNVQLSSSLMLILENHARPFENCHNLHLKRSNKIPSWCSVLDLLQTYLNGFPYNIPIKHSPISVIENSSIFSSLVNRERFSRMAATAYMKTDKSHHLCAEFCSSVRILFDALLVDYLLYPTEEKIHVPFVRNPDTKSELIRKIYSPNHNILLPPEEIKLSPTLPCLVYECVYVLRLLVRLPALINQMALTKCRRSIVLRHLYLFISYLDATHAFWFTDSIPTTDDPFAYSSIGNQPRSSNSTPVSSASTTKKQSSTPHQTSTALKPCKSLASSKSESRKKNIGITNDTNKILLIPNKNLRSHNRHVKIEPTNSQNFPTLRKRVLSSSVCQNKTASLATGSTSSKRKPTNLIKSKPDDTFSIRMTRSRLSLNDTIQSDIRHLKNTTVASHFKLGNKNVKSTVQLRHRTRSEFSRK